MPASSTLGAELPRQAQGPPRDHRRHQRSGECRAAPRRHRRSRHRIALRHPAVGDRQHARRCLWPAHRLDDVHLAHEYHLILEVDPRFPERPRSAEQHLCPLRRGPTGAAERPGAHRRHGGAARGQSSGAIPGGDDFVQSASRRVDRRGGRRHPSARNRYRQARLARHQLPRQCAGVHFVAVERARADRRGAGGRLHHPRRALREA